MTDRATERYAAGGGRLGLRFNALLIDDRREVRFERAVVGLEARKPIERITQATELAERPVSSLKLSPILVSEKQPNWRLVIWSGASSSEPPLGASVFEDQTIDQPRCEACVTPRVRLSFLVTNATQGGG